MRQFDHQGVLAGGAELGALEVVGAVELACNNVWARLGGREGSDLVTVLHINDKLALA
jgi:hypothetical protein